MSKLDLTTRVSEIPGIGPRLLSKLEKLGIKTVRNLLWHFPVRYEDWSAMATVAELNPGDEKTIQATVQEIKLIRTWKRKMFIVEALVGDETGSVEVVWFNQPYIKNILKTGSLVNLSGKVGVKKNKLFLSSPAYEIITSKNKSGTRHTGRLVPIYPETKGLTSKGLRLIIERVFENLEKLEEFLPAEIIEEYKLPEINTALRQIHFPEKTRETVSAKRRFAFEELFLLHLRNILQRINLTKESARSINIEANEIRKIVNTLPFKLTASQEKALAEVLDDLAKTHPMNRLLQGDVGSGKTIVAGLAAILTAKDYQAALMVPTEILARQHYQTLTRFFSHFEGGIVLLVSKETRVFWGDDLETETKKPELLKDIAGGKVRIVIGTHALISSSAPRGYGGSSEVLREGGQKVVKFKNLALLVVDEQHRFGVAQRASLLRETLAQNKIYPHLLSMSATPIPRTLMLSVFGDLSLSVIDELPQGRKKTITKIVDPENRDKAYAFIRGQVRRGRQVFVVCPRIEPPEKEIVTFKVFQLLEVKTVKEEYEKLSKKVFPDLRVGILHGKLKSAEKEKVMKDFAERDIDVLVTTSVVEVGVDIPNATIMMIEGAERFGLAQLYQFRGRVGRGEHQSFCLLFTESKSQMTHERLGALLLAKNGFELAETDLKLRGPGEFLGESQTGLPDVAMKALQSPELIQDSRIAAEKIIAGGASLQDFPLLREKLKEFRLEVHLE